MATSLTAARQNRLLALLGTELDQLLPDLEFHDAGAREVLHERGRSCRYANFPLTGVASIIATTGGIDLVEAATVGNEGMTGLPLFLGGDASNLLEVIMQVPGMVLRMPAEAFKDHVRQAPALTRVLHLYTQAILTQMAQTSACNRAHLLEARCARWLLQIDDRMAGHEFPLTQEFLAYMLGVRRPTVTDVARTLQLSGLIQYRRGIITIVNREGLEAAACDCYLLITGEYERLLGRASETVSQG